MTPHQRSSAEARTAKVAHKSKVKVLRNPKLRQEIEDATTGYQAARRHLAEYPLQTCQRMAATHEWIAWHLRQSAEFHATETPSINN